MKTIHLVITGSALLLTPGCGGETSPATSSSATGAGGSQSTASVTGAGGASGSTGSGSGGSGGSGGGTTAECEPFNHFGAPTRGLESWAPKATLSPGSPDIVYPVGALVMYDAEMYECTAQNSGFVPPDHAEAWKKLPLPVDDLRAMPGSPYAGMGVK